MERKKGRIYVAINMTAVANNERTFELMMYIGPKVCMLTAGSAGFLGYQANLQTGILPWAGRYGGASLHLDRELNPVRFYQYTMWLDPEAHLSFHRENFARVFELCASCLWVMAAGHWEPVYEVASAWMPPLLSRSQLSSATGDQPQLTQANVDAPQRSVAITEHTVQAEKGATFDRGIVQTVKAIAEAPGFLGYMLLRQIAVNPLGSLMLDPKSMMEMLETIGANPPADPKPLFDRKQARPSHPEYLLHTEWETPECAQSGLGRLLVHHETRRLYCQHVLPHLIRGHYTLLFKPTMEEPSWRKRLT